MKLLEALAIARPTPGTTPEPRIHLASGLAPRDHGGGEGRREGA